MENNIDRLFQDKLARHEVQPTPQAWEQVRKELDEGRKPTLWLRIAASVILLAVSTLLIFKSTDNTQTDFSASIAPDQPMPPAQFNWELAEIVEKKDVQEQQIVVQDQVKLKQKIAVAHVDISNEVIEEVNQNLDKTELPVLSPMDVAPIDLNTAIVARDEVVERSDLVVETLPQLQVQITYKAADPSLELPEEKTRVAKLWARAKKIVPGEMLASIRETKNDFFNGKRN